MRYITVVKIFSGWIYKMFDKETFMESGSINPKGKKKFACVSHYTSGFTFSSILETICTQSVQFSCSAMLEWAIAIWLVWSHGLQHTRPPCPSPTPSWSLLKLMFIVLVMPSNHLILYHTLPLPPSIFYSIRVFSNKSVLRIRWPKYWSFSICSSNEYSGLISFRMD